MAGGGLKTNVWAGREGRALAVCGPRTAPHSIAITDARKEERAYVRGDDGAGTGVSGMQGVKMYDEWSGRGKVG